MRPFGAMRPVAEPAMSRLLDTVPPVPLHSPLRPPRSHRRSTTRTPPVIGARSTLTNADPLKPNVMFWTLVTGAAKPLYVAWRSSAVERRTMASLATPGGFEVAKTLLEPYPKPPVASAEASAVAAPAVAASSADESQAERLSAATASRSGKRKRGMTVRRKGKSAEHAARDRLNRGYAPRLLKSESTTCSNYGF